MKVVVAAVGRVRDPELRALLDDYSARIRRYCPFEEIEVKGDAALAKAVSGDGWLVACEVRGGARSSEVFARELEAWGTRGKGRVVFVIGGAEGIPAELSGKADAQLSLSHMTLPHRLARLVLLEQIYRAFTILRGEPYARE